MKASAHAIIGEMHEWFRFNTLSCLDRSLVNMCLLRNPLI